MNLLGRTHVLIGILLFLILVMALAIPVMAESNPNVLLFEVQGNQHIAVERILGVVSNTKMGAPLDPKLIQLDMQAIMALGYFTDVHVTTEKLLDGVKLVFEVVENPLFKDVKITGLTKVKPEEFKSFFSQKPGEVFNTITFKSDLSKAIKFCQEKKGLFIEPKNQNNIGISPTGDIKVELVELKYGKVKILGLVKTKEFIVRRELSIKEGEIIDSNLLKEEYLKLMRLRLFDGMDMRFEKSETPDSLDLVLEAKEAQTGSFSFGFSYSETTEEFGGLLGYSEANLMGLGQNLALDLNFSETSRNVQFSFLEPWLDQNHTSFGLSMWNTDSNISSTMGRWISDSVSTDMRYDPTMDPNTPAVDGPKYREPDHKDGAGNPDYIPWDSLPRYYNSVYDLDLIRTGLSLSSGRELWKDVRGNVRLNFEKNQIDKFWGANTTIPFSLTNPMFNGGPMEFWDNSAELGLVKNKLSYQDRNFVDGGYQLSANYTVAGPYLGGAFDYSKTVLEGKWFKAITPNLVLGTRLQGALIEGDYPDYDALYLGGMYKLRGYEDRRFDNANTAQLIGDQYLLSNTELRYRLPSNKNLEFVLFYDAGQMTNGDSHTLKSDYGVGFRYNIPFLGVLRIDRAWNRDGDGTTVFSLGEMF